MRQSYGRRHNPSILKARLTPTSGTSKVIRTASPASLYKHHVLRIKDTRYKHRFLSTQLSRTPEISPLRARNCQHRELPEQTTFHRDGLSVLNYCRNHGTSLTWHLDMYFWFCFLVYRGSSVSLQCFVFNLLAVMSARLFRVLALALIFIYSRKKVTDCSRNVYCWKSV